MDFTCRETTESGDLFVRWEGTMSQLDGDERLEGQMELSIVHEDGTTVCRGVYDLTLSKI